MQINKVTGFIALGLCATAASAQPGDKTQIDIRVRVKGTSEWVDVINYSAATPEVALDVEVGVSFYRNAGYGLEASTFTLMTSNWLATDVVTLLDRPDSSRHPDGRRGTFNFSGQAQAAYTTGVDAGRLRVAAPNNPNDIRAGGVHIHQNTPTALLDAFDESDGFLGYRFDITLVNPTPGIASSRTLTCDAPRGHVNSYRAYSCFSCAGPMDLLPGLLPTDIATINVHWPKCASACTADLNCDGFVTGADFDAFIAGFVDGSIDADIDGNGFVTGDDFDAFAAAFVAGC